MSAQQASEPASDQSASGRVRLAPEARKQQLRTEARAVFAERGYAASGLAEIAERAGVNKRLLYYYFPDGRSELYIAVMAELAAELLARVGEAVAAPVSATGRIERLLDALIGYFEAEPDAFALLFRDPFGVREPEVIQQAVAVQAELARHVAKLLAGAGAAPMTLLGVTSGSVAYLLKVIELEVGGDIGREAARQACLSCLLGVRAQLGEQA